MMAMRAIIWRELLRFLHQRERFIAALVRPLVWLLIFGAGFRAALGLAIYPPYDTYIRYETYIVPGLCGIILLFNGMQSALSIVYDREMGSMKLLLVAPISRRWMLFSKLIASAFVGMLQVWTFLLIAFVVGIQMEPMGYVWATPAIFLTGLMLGSLGLAISTLITQLQNFAGVMNFVIFPMFFASTALYPLWRMQENAPWLAKVVEFNPFSHGVELIRFTLYGKLEWVNLGVVVGCLGVFFGLAVWGYQSRKGMLKKKFG
jgi:ABC-2 type transport system permease protein